MKAARALGHVVDGLFPIGLDGVFRGDADEATPAALAHARDGGAANAHGGKEVGGPGFLVVGIGQFQGIALGAGDTGGVHYDVDLAEAGLALLHQLVHRRLVGHVGGDQQRIAWQALGRLFQLALLQIGEHQLDALLASSFAVAQTHATAGTP